ncbi:DUF4433 domain-containing protein [Viridibacillus sp. YIM B01967]|uniref:DUF4433 domain-containing protein n=1 Tax=Viridibacillus soli TaxID=2798301 RepID=A0ABS1H3H7_9BACL|nr:DarT ssDNA thymidine ADP-ribosyltransferase family protein [Viridibacillus soli]MBK3493973.1 DUF4433 domain-containing protein [Viridibacillus soli]
MSLVTTKSGKLLYHLTKFKNLESILKKGLLPRSLLIKEGINFKDVADNKIITKRTEMKLDEFVPFHFHPHSAFDHAVKNAHDDEFVYICITRNFAKNNDFKVLPIHPLTTSDDCEIYDYDEGIESIDWDTMSQKGNDETYVKQVKMAECLSEYGIEAKGFRSICVGDKDLQKRVLKLLEANKLKGKMYVDIMPWAK